MNAPVALVTGAGSGIGLATAALLARHGWRVFGTVRTAAAERQLREAATGVAPVEMDVTDPESVASARGVVEASAAGDGLATLVNNAGIALPAPLETAPPDGVLAEFATNALGALRVTQAFLPLLKRSGGRAVFVGSPLANQSRELCGGYGASKAALRSIADTLRLELAPTGIGVCHVEADKIATPMWSKAANELDRLPRTEAYAAAIDAARRLAATADHEGGFAPPEIVAHAIWRALAAESLPAEISVP